MPQGSKENRAIERDDLIVRELGAIKRLLAVLLMKAGTSQAEIATALQIDQGNLSRDLPARKFKRFGTGEVQNARG